MQKKRLDKPKQMTKQHFKCAVIGEWHLAFTTAACLASLGHTTLLVNSLQTQEPEWPILSNWFPALNVNEPGLVDLIEKNRAENLMSYANGVDGSWSADIVWLAVDTPVDENDVPDTKPLEVIAKQISKTGACKQVFAVSSQVPIGFCNLIEKKHGLKVAYIPENLRLGVAIETFMKADRTVIGANTVATRKTILNLLRGLDTVFLECNLVTSEMIKHATNSFLATSISFANEMARVGESMGVDNQLVGHALKLDKRIGKQAYVSPGLGFAGGTLPRDLQVLQRHGKRMQIPTPLVDAVLRINRDTAEAVADGLKHYLKTIKGKRILLVGYTYKPNTDTLRRSPSLDLAKVLKNKALKFVGMTL